MAPYSWPQYLIERRIDADLSVAGLTPPLHLPVLAGLAQGPGFPNLSCLGLLSDRVLRRYVTAGPPARWDHHARTDHEEKAIDRSTR